MSSQAKRSIAIIGAFVLVLLGVLSLGAIADDDPKPAPAATGETQLVRADSHVLGEEGDSDVTFVEFLDFECEACRAFYPAVEQLRADFPDDLTLAIRYFPIPSHANAQNAALAVEAAARQGQLEGMYQRMYDTQAEWGEKPDSQASVFRGFAEDLGLDLQQYDADVADPEVAARVQRDFDDGRALGVQGTPTFFLDGQRLEASDPNELYQLVQEALQG